MNRTLRKIRKLIIHPRLYFYDFIRKKFRLPDIDVRLNRINQRVGNLAFNTANLYSCYDHLTIDDFVRLRSKEFYEKLGYFPNFKNPKSFNEKINYLNLFYYNQYVNYCVDKYTAKTYFADKVGKEHVIPLLGVFDDPNDIDFDSLPDKFVIKDNLSGFGYGVRIIEDKSVINIDKLKYELNSLLFDSKRSMVPQRNEIKRRLIIEEYIETKERKLDDYKFFCFNGRPRFLYVQDRQYLGSGRVEVHPRQSFFDLDFNRLGFYNLETPPIKKSVPPPINLDQMIDISIKLSNDFPFVRVDLYNVEGKIYIGELTFNPTGGYIPFNDVKYDFQIGEYLDLTSIDKKFLRTWQEVISQRAYRENVQ